MTILTFIIVVFSWIIALSIIVLLPTDLATTFQIRCLKAGGTNCGSIFLYLSFLTPDTISTIFRVLYWANFFNTWVFIPVHQDYTRSCAFSFKQRCWDAVRFNILIYGVAGVIGVIFLIYIAAIRQLQWSFYARVRVVNEADGAHLRLRSPLVSFNLVCLVLAAGAISPPFAWLPLTLTPCFSSSACWASASWASVSTHIL